VSSWVPGTQDDIPSRSLHIPGTGRTRPAPSLRRVERYRVLVVDDHPLFRDAMARLLRSWAEVEV